MSLCGLQKVVRDENFWQWYAGKATNTIRSYSTCQTSWRRGPQSFADDQQIGRHVRVMVAPLLCTFSIPVEVQH